MEHGQIMVLIVLKPRRCLFFRQWEQNHSSNPGHIGSNWTITISYVITEDKHVPSALPKYCHGKHNVIDSILVYLGNIFIE